MEAKDPIEVSDSRTPPARLTRSGTRRQGDEYQDVQGLSLLVEWLEHSLRYQWVKLEAAASGFLDDILALRSDGVLEIWQVKFSTGSHKPEDAWTWDTLLKQKEGATTRSLLQKWFKTWQDYLSKGTQVSPGLLSNRRGAAELALDAPREGKVRWGELAEEMRQKIVAQLGDEGQAKAFFEIFRFRLDEPSLRELEEGSRLRFEHLGGTPGGWYALEKEVRQWVNLHDTPPPAGHIYLDEVRRIAKLKAHPVRLHTFLPPITFFARYMRPNRLFHHRLAQIGRRAQLKELLAFVEGKNQIGILPGRGGSGKSKLLHSLCRRLARLRPDLSVRLVAENLPIKETALEELPDDRCLVVVDDAHRADGVEVILAAAQQNPALRVLLVARPYATDYLAAQARNAGFDRNDIVINGLLPDLNPDEQRRLARCVLGRDWAGYADKLASVTRDSPLLTVLGGELLRTEQVAPSFLSRHDAFRQEVLSRFRDIQLGEIISQLDGRFTSELCANALPIVAALTPLDLENAEVLSVMARLLDTDAVKLKQLLGALVKAGALVRGGRLVRIVPDVLSDFILHEACFTPDGLPTGWATRVYEEVGGLRLDVVLRNLAEVDWRVRTAPLAKDATFDNATTSETGLLDVVWRDIEKQFLASTLAERKAWLTRLDRIAYMQPHRLWPLVEIAMNEPAAEEKVDDSREPNPWHRPTTESEVLAALPPVLGGVAHDERFTSRCADLLWKMGRDLETSPGHSSSAMETLRRLASYERGKPFEFIHIILQRCREWMEDPNIHGYRHSVLEVISPMLSRRVESSEPDGRWVSSDSSSSPAELLVQLRRGALELVDRCAQSRERRIVLAALQTLRTPVMEEGLWQLKKEAPAEWQSWEWEVLGALEIVARIAASNEDPFVRLRIWEYLHLQAERGPRPVVQSRAREILEAIPHSFESRLILLVTSSYEREEYSRTWANPGEDRGHWLKADKATRLLIDQKRYQKNEEFARQVLSEWMDKYPSARAAFDALDEWIERIDLSGWGKNLWTRSNPLMVRLATDHPSYAREWCEIALEKPGARATGMCDDLLWVLRHQDPKGTLELAQRFLAHGHPNLKARVAGSYSWRGWPKDPLPDEWQIVKELLTCPEAQVRHITAQIVSAIALTDKKRAIELVLETDMREDSALAEGLFEIFGEYHGFDFNKITPDELERLLGKLATVESVRSYHLGQFLLHGALRDPKAVARLLIGRVQHKIKLDKERWESPAADEGLLAKQLVDNFGGLPESGFHEDKFGEVVRHPDYAEALRLIRDAGRGEESRSGLLYEDTLSSLFRDFSLNYNRVSLEVLNEWINSGDCDLVRDAMHLLGDTFLGFYVNNITFVSNYLQRGQECGASVFEEIEQAMLHSAEFGPPRVIASHRGEVSNALFHSGLKALEQAKGDDLALAFFKKLRDKGREMIQSEMQRDAEEEIFFRSN